VPTDDWGQSDSVDEYTPEGSRKTSLTGSTRSDNSETTSEKSEEGEFCLSDLLRSSAEQLGMKAPGGVNGCKKEKMKTRLCKHWLENTDCPYRDRCAYAHGKHQLRLKEIFL
jgi:hypothetical protein